MTNKQWKTVGKINKDSPRAQDWYDIFDGYEIPLISFIPFQCNLPGHPNALAYWLNLRLITDEQRERLIKSLADRFEEDEQFVRSKLDRYGVPILAEDLVVSSSDRGLFFSAVLDMNDADTYDGDEDEDDPYDDWSDDEA